MFELSETQKLFQRNVRQFAKKELAPQAAHWDATEEFPWDSVRKMAEIGLTGLRLPKQYGGIEADLISTGIALEEIARFDHSCAIILCASNITGRVLLHASEDIKNTWLPRIARGESIMAFASTEPESGSDIRAIKTLAERQEDVYVVNGEKTMITFTGIAQAYVTLVKTNPKKEGLSCLFIEANSPGISTRPLRSFGWKATKWGNVVFDNVKVPTENLIGEEGNALGLLKTTVEQRALTGIIALGTAEQALEEAIEYARIRKVFGKPLGKFEGIQFKIVEDYTSLEAAKLVCYKALHFIEKNAEEASLWAAMANLMGGEVAFKAVNDAMDIFGGLGYTSELPLERYLRDVKAEQIANATLKIDIGKRILGEDFLPYA